MMADLQNIKEKAEAAVNIVAGIYGMCCGHITLAQCTGFLSLIANAGGAALVLIQLYRTLTKKEG
jgi:hypothetical protein